MRVRIFLLVICAVVVTVALVGIGRVTTSRYCSPCSSIIGLKLKPGRLIMPTSVEKLGTTPKVGSAFKPFS